MKSIFKNVILKVSAAFLMIAPAMATDMNQISEGDLKSMGSDIAAELSAIPELAWRPFTKEDIEWALEGGMKKYTQIYEGKAYFVNSNFGTDEPPAYTLLTNTIKDGRAKAFYLMSEGILLMETYLGNLSSGLFHPVVFTLDGENIGGIFYRQRGKNTLHIDECVFVKPIKDDLIRHILSNWLREQEPKLTTHTTSLRPINTEYLTFLNELGFSLQTVEETKECSDPLLYNGLSKTYTN